MDTELTAVKDPRRDFIQSSTSFSWADYITVVLIESGHVSSASLQSLASANLWAGSPGFRLTYSELKSIYDGFQEDSGLRLKGLFLNGRHFTLTRITGLRVMVGRDAQSGAGAVLYLGNRCLLTAIYEDNNHPGTCYRLVVQMGDYLVNCGF